MSAYYKVPEIYFFKVENTFFVHFVGSVNFADKKIGCLR